VWCVFVSLATATAVGVWYCTWIGYRLQTIATVYKATSAKKGSLLEKAMNLKIKLYLLFSLQVISAATSLSTLTKLWTTLYINCRCTHPEARTHIDVLEERLLRRESLEVMRSFITYTVRQISWGRSN
jgi:hypothetical protein